MAIYSAVVAAPAAFPAVTAPDVTIPFTPRRVTIVNLDPAIANYVEFSYDAVALHGRLTPTINPQYESTQGAVKLYLRRGAGAPNVLVIAEA